MSKKAATIMSIVPAENEARYLETFCYAANSITLWCPSVEALFAGRDIEMESRDAGADDLLPASIAYFQEFFRGRGIAFNKEIFRLHTLLESFSVIFERIKGEVEQESRMRQPRNKEDMILACELKQCCRAIDAIILVPAAIASQGGRQGLESADLSYHHGFINDDVGHQIGLSSYMLATLRVTVDHIKKDEAKNLRSINCSQRSISGGGNNCSGVSSRPVEPPASVMGGGGGGDDVMPPHSPFSGS